MILPTEHSMINTLHGNLGSVEIRHHRFVCNLKRKGQTMPYITLSAGEKRYLTSLYTDLVAQGLAEAIGP